ncbi:replication endonuclease [Alloalcanivorax mobilis]|uniref:replication endonuclease n=1 Tax=Alloalcanivorax mobilis TaxID=2019569 RepID=UPI0018E49298|nr:replication endonuclease [Alloalcanivorax mobilis]
MLTAHWQQTQQAAMAARARAHLLDQQRFADENRTWAERTAGPAWAALQRPYMAIAQRASYADASRYLSDYAPLVRHDLYLADTDAGIRAFCDQRVQECRRWIMAESETDALRYCAAILDRYGLDWPAPASPIDGPAVDLFPLAARLQCPKWWRRRVRVLQAREVDQYARQRRRVAKYREVYCSDWLVKNRRAAARRNRDMLESTTATNDDGQEYTLAELADLGTANLSNRRNELMTRIRGFEEVATARGHAGVFWTFTTASRWHRMRWLPKPGKAVKNSRWEGSTPRDAQNQLCTLWARIRAALHRAEIRVYGFRVAEPHHDGTPHWHLLLFMRPGDVRAARRIARRVLVMADNPTERGARRRRFEHVQMDASRGTAAGYIAKYIAKNIDGRGVRGALGEQDDDSGLDMSNAAERVQAWASGWGIRQFQQIGGPSVTVWRELRRLWASGGPTTGDLFDAGDALEAAGEAADAGDWAAYVEAMGGPELPRANRIISPGYWLESGIDTDTGEVVPGRATTEYGDRTAGALFGLWAGTKPVLTRFYRWAISYARKPEKKPEIKPVAGWFLTAPMELLRAAERIAAVRAGPPRPGAALDLCQ